MEFFSIDNIFFELLDYPISFIEFIGTISGLLSVYLASRANIWTWPIGIINEFAFFSLFYQYQLYSDMILQIYFFVMTLYGWYYWNKNIPTEKIGKVNTPLMYIYLATIILGTIVMGYCMQNIHLIFPNYFPYAASYPFLDAFTTVTSIIATILLSQKRIETWFLWIIVDIVCIFIYLLKGIHLIMLEYLTFLTICLIGYTKWKMKLKLEA